MLLPFAGCVPGNLGGGGDFEKDGTGDVEDAGVEPGLQCVFGRDHVGIVDGAVEAPVDGDEVESGESVEECL